MHVVLFIPDRQSRVHVTCQRRFAVVDAQLHLAGVTEATKLEKSKTDRGKFAKADASEFDAGSGEFVNPLGSQE